MKILVEIENGLRHFLRLSALRLSRFALAAGLSLGLLITGCGDSQGHAKVASLKSPESPAIGSPALPADAERATQAFRACMREHGITLPEPGSSTTVDFDSPQFKAADQACSRLVKGSAPSQGLDPTVSDRLLRYAQCMREHGIPVTDPQQQGVGVGIVFTDPNLDTSSPQFAAAQQACSRYVRPTPSGVSGATQSRRP